MDIQWTSLLSSTTEEPIPLFSRVVSQVHRRTCRCCVVAVWVFHHSLNRMATVDVSLGFAVDLCLMLPHWMTNTAAIVDSLADHFQSVSPLPSPQCHVAQVLLCQSSWVGGEHLSGPMQEMCVPAPVLGAWLATQCEQFASGPHHAVAEVLSPSLFVHMQVETPVASPRSPFQNAGQNPVGEWSGSPIVVSHPLATMLLAVESPPSQSASPFQFPKVGQSV